MLKTISGIIFATFSKKSKRKHIKKAFKIVRKSIHLLIEIAVFLLIVTCVSLRFDKVQTSLAQTLTERISKDLGTTVSIDKLDIVPFNRVSLKKIIILDLEKDTVINAGSIDVLLSDLRLRENKLSIENLTLANADVHLIKRKGKKGFSFQFIIDYFSGEKKENSNSKNFLITAKKIKLKNSNFKFINNRSDATYYGMDYNDLQVNNINLTVSEFQNFGSNIKMKINHLSSTEKSKFVLSDFTGIVEMDSNFVHIDSLKITTPNSTLVTDYFRFEFKDPNDFDDDFINLVTMKTVFRNSNLNLKDLKYFTSYFEGIDRVVNVSGKFEGLVSDFKTKNLLLKLDKNTSFYGNIAMKGLPDTDKTTFKAKVHKFVSNERELNNLDVPPFDKHLKMSIPKEMEGFGDVSLRGNLAGRFDDLKGKLIAITSQGNLEVGARYWNENNTTFVDGNVVAENFNLGTFLKNRDLKELDADLETKLKWNSKEGIDLKAKGELPKIVYKGYKYTNIKIDGDITEKSFIGKASINDKNGIMDFDGKIEMDKEIPEFNFKTRVRSLNLAKLKLTSDSLERLISGNIEINGKGNSIDNSIGILKIKELEYIQEGEKYRNREINITSSEENGYKKVALFSDIADIEIGGKFEISMLQTSFELIGKKMFPAIFGFDDSMSIANQNFDFKVFVKNYNPIYKLFTPEINIAGNTKLNGNFKSEASVFEFLGQSDSISIGDNRLEKLTVKVEKPAEILTARVEVKQVNLSQNLQFDNVVFSSLIKEDHIMPSIKWKSKDGTNYGKIQGDGYWYSKDYFDFLILPSYVHFQNRNWEIEEDATLVIDSTSYSFSGIKATNNFGESISVEGNITENPKDLLYVYLDEFKVENLNSLLGNSATKYYGNINGSACLSSLYDSVKIESDFFIEELTVNKELVGDIAFNSSWINSKEALYCKGELLREDINTFDFLGFYYLFREDNSLDFNCIMDKTPLAFLNSYLEGQGVSDIGGVATGNIAVTGNRKKPLLEGDITFDRVGFKVDYLNTSYDFTGKFLVNATDIYTDNLVELRDKENNIAQFFGSIYHENFSDFDYNISIEIPDTIHKKGNQKELKPFKESERVDNKFLSLNTNQELNGDFYGKVYGTGDINISGYKGDVAIEVDAKTERGTKFTLPLNGSSEVELEEYIVFVDKNSLPKLDKSIDFDGIDLDIKVEVTPDAEMEIIFDEIYGDVIKGVGSGNLAMSVDKNGEFRMSGKYVIEKGDYLFTMGILNFENLINKKFSIEDGSSISWYGDPLNAEVDINTVYNLKASLYEIMPKSTTVGENNYRIRRDVKCHMNLSQNLLAPEINFGIEVPHGDEDVKRAIISLVQTEEELNKQVFALLLLNRFLAPANSISEEGRGNSLLSTTTSELLSNQLTNWLLKISSGALGVNYIPGDNITSDEIAVQLSKELFNEKLVINTNFGIARGNTINQNKDELIGDVNVEYKINENGTFRVRVFSRTNEYDITNINQSKTTSGVGVYYKKEFSKWKDYFKIKK